MNLKSYFLGTFFLYFTLFSQQWLWAAEDAPVTIAIGEQKSLPADPGARFSVGNSEVIQVKATQLSSGASVYLIKGKASGYSDLVILGSDATSKTISFRVVSKKQMAMVRDGENQMGAPRGLSISPQGNSWLMRGEAKTFEDFNVAHAIGSQKNVKSFVKIHPLERLKAEEQIKRRLALLHKENIQVLGVGGTILLRGDVDTLSEKAFIEEVATEVFSNLRSHLKVPFESAGRLRFQAKILELNRNSAQELGFDWSKEIPSAIQLSTKFTKAALGLDATLRMLERRGQAKLLSKPNLLLNEKGVAELRVGGEIPISTHTKNSSNVQWKPYGLTLKLELPGISQERARTKVSVEISGLDQTTMRDGIPGIRTSKLDTQVDMEIGRPVLLSGLIETRDQETESMIPVLGNIPVLGELFKSRNFQQNKSELVIVLEANR